MHMQSNDDEKKYRFFDPFTGEAPLRRLKNYLRSTMLQKRLNHIAILHIY